MPQLYKHNKGKWLLSTVVSKNTASNEEKWRSLRGRPVMCHWPTLSPKINHERGALWLRCGHPWSINLPPSPSLPSPRSLPLCLPASLSLSLFLPNIHKCWHKLNQHKWRDELMTFPGIFVLITAVLTSKARLFEEWIEENALFLHSSWVYLQNHQLHIPTPNEKGHKINDQNIPRTVQGSRVQFRGISIHAAHYVYIANYKPNLSQLSTKNTVEKNFW